MAAGCDYCERRGVADEYGIGERDYCGNRNQRNDAVSTESEREHGEFGGGAGTLTDSRTGDGDGVSGGFGWSGSLEAGSVGHRGEGVSCAALRSRGSCGQYADWRMADWAERGAAAGLGKLE